MPTKAKGETVSYFNRALTILTIFFFHCERFYWVQWKASRMLRMLSAFLFLFFAGYFLTTKFFCLNKFLFQLKEFLVVGRKLPSAKEHNPPIYKMQIFASNHVIAKSRFWYFTSMLRRVKKANGEILECKEVGLVTWWSFFFLSKICSSAYFHRFFFNIFINNFCV